MKQKTVYQCTNCAFQPPKWVGCCPSCQEWNSISSTVAQVVSKQSQAAVLTMAPLSSFTAQTTARMRTGLEEWDRVLGGGIMPGSFLILTGDPGIGKSTLLLQIADRISQQARVFYFSSEESLEQVTLRAQRIGCRDSAVLFSDTAQLESLITTVTQEKPDLVIIDSIQNCYAAQIQTVPGSIAQLRETAFHLMRLAKENNIAIIASGHITKEGEIAGPKMLEHMVDGVFYLQGEDRWQTRVLRSVKNRFGAINEIGFFQMEENGMVEVPNINQSLINSISDTPGSVLISSLEGSRPLLIELQALTVPSKFGMPQRVVTGMDPKRIVLMAAILEKYLQIRLSDHDIFFKVSGNLKIKESGADLGIALALLSSYFQQPLPSKSIALGEVYLTGQIKPINLINLHINEAQKFGIGKIFVSSQQKIEHATANILRLNHVYELVNLFSEN